MTLSSVLKGQRVRIVEILDAATRMQALRLGMGEGSEVICEEVIPTGAIVLRKNRQRIAVGRKLAGTIRTETVSERGCAGSALGGQG